MPYRVVAVTLQKRFMRRSRGLWEGDEARGVAVRLPPQGTRQLGGIAAWDGRDHPDRTHRVRSQRRRDDGGVEHAARVGVPVSEIMGVLEIDLCSLRPPKRIGPETHRKGRRKAYMRGR